MTTISVDVTPEPIKAHEAARASRALRLRQIDATYEAVIASVHEERAVDIRTLIRESGERLAPTLARVDITDDGRIEGNPLLARLAVHALTCEVRSMPARLMRVYHRYALILQEIEEAWDDARQPFDFWLSPKSERRNEPTP